MTRIVAGLAKGRRLSVPQRGTRPTSDRAREAMFNTLRAHLDVAGARVLDLFAGSGAVGLEALSRGAAASVLVESDRAAAEVVRRNIAAVGLPGAVLHRRTAESFLADGGPDAPFHLVFADPPYSYPDAQLTDLLGTLAERRWLADGAVLVIERSARAAEPAWPEGVALITRKQYGEGALWYGRVQP